MFHALQALAGTAAIERGTLLLNHVLAAEPAATDRLKAHAGRCIQLQFVDWPRLLPPWPAMAFRITPAGLIEWCGEVMPAQADLRIAIDAGNPGLLAIQVLSGERLRVDVAGDSALGADVSWLLDNLRWDLEDDLGRMFGAAPAREVVRFGRALAAGIRAAARRFGPAPASAEPASR